MAHDEHSDADAGNFDEGELVPRPVVTLHNTGQLGRNNHGGEEGGSGRGFVVGGCTLGAIEPKKSLFHVVGVLHGQPKLRARFHRQVQSNPPSCRRWSPPKALVEGPHKPIRELDVARHILHRVASVDALDVLDLDLPYLPLGRAMADRHVPFDVRGTPKFLAALRAEKVAAAVVGD